MIQWFFSKENINLGSQQSVAISNPTWGRSNSSGEKSYKATNTQVCCWCWFPKSSHSPLSSYCLPLLSAEKHNTLASNSLNCQYLTRSLTFQSLLPACCLGEPADLLPVQSPHFYKCLCTLQPREYSINWTLSPGSHSSSLHFPRELKQIWIPGWGS